MISDYGDDATIYVSDRNYQDIIRRLENDVTTMVDWFRSNFFET